MIKKLVAIIVAAACAGLFVGFAPGFSPELEASTPRATNHIVPSVVSVNDTLDQEKPIVAEIHQAVEQRLRKKTGGAKSCARKAGPITSRAAYATTARAIAKHAWCASSTSSVQMRAWPDPDLKKTFGER